jgi:hypothetical protein
MAKVITPKFRVSFPAVTEPKMNSLSKKLEYSVVALFPKNADLSALKKAAEEVMVEAWGPDKNKWPKPIRSPFRLQEEKFKMDDNGKEIIPGGHERGAVFLNLKSNKRPGLVDQQRQDIIDPTEFYAGCYARAEVNAYVYDQAGNRGVSFGLNNLQKMADGEPLGGRSRPEDVFTAVEVDEPNKGNGSADDLFS